MAPSSLLLLICLSLAGSVERRQQRTPALLLGQAAARQGKRSSGLRLPDLLCFKFVLSMSLLSLVLRKKKDKKKKKKDQIETSTRLYL